MLRSPVSVCGSVRTGEHDRVAVGIVQPDFPMVRTTVTVRRIPMAGQNDLRLQVHSSGYGRVEVVDFKPKEHTISVREVSVANGTVMMLHVPMVQLKNQPAVRNEPLILGAAVVALATKETLIPATAGLNVSDTNKRLWAHMNGLCLTR
jgi:hypothetical protein